MVVSVLYINDVPIECINKAALVYHVPAELIISVLKVENGHAGTAKLNSNGSYDYGPMQVNSIWLDRVKSYGYTRNMLQYDPCTNVWVGTWILSQRIASTSNLWRGIGAYHSYTETENVPYQYKVWRIYHLLHSYLSSPDAAAQNKNIKV